MILRADARSIPLRDGCVQTVVTSPPYWGLRDYQVAGQIGLEPTPDEYLATMVAVFREVRRVLRDDGVLWLNLGDSYAGGGHGGGGSFAKDGIRCAPLANKNEQAWWKAGGMRVPAGVKAKDLVGVPWRVAFALQADGWYLRSDIVWAKPNPMPESVTDRPTRSHEYIFLLAKSERYFYDADAIREGFSDERMGNPGAYHRTSSAAKGANRDRQDLGFLNNGNGWNADGAAAGRNKRDVWTVNSEPTPEAHFATFPQALITPCILAGSRPGDVVLDPFLGSGTVGRVCERLGRRWAGLELSAEYIGIARRKTAQRGLFVDSNSAERASSRQYARNPPGVSQSGPMTGG